MKKQTGQSTHRAERVHPLVRRLCGLLLIAGFVATLGLADLHSHDDQASEGDSCAVCRIVVESGDGFAAASLQPAFDLVTADRASTPAVGQAPRRYNVSDGPPRAPPLV